MAPLVERIALGGLGADCRLIVARRVRAGQGPTEAAVGG
jgi:hypothetical protein